MSKSLVKQEYTLEQLEHVERFRELIMEFEEQLVNLPGSYGDPKTPGQNKVANKINPLKHTFADGLYIREIFMPKGQIISTGIHKKEHPYFILKGDISVLTDEGIKRIKAPYNGITKPGTKRLIYMHEDSVWITVHATDKSTPEEVLEDVVAKDFNDPDISIESMKKQLKLKNK
tara:strand:- start:560 stop:1081 length:522 start_codon:yes stop_codon:yes gene_type:complete